MLTEETNIGISKLRIHFDLGHHLSIHTMQLQVLFSRTWNNSIVRMLGVGILNTVFGYSIYAALLFFGATYLVALFIANAVGVIFNYYSVGRIVFQERGGRIIFGKFVATYAATYIANAIVLHILTIHIALNPYQGQLICLPLSVSLNWTLLTFWAFKRRPR